MITVLVIIHVLVCVGLIIGILLQSGKGADLGAAFGGSSQTIFGSAGATPFLNKLTAGIAIAFMVTSLALAFFASRPQRSSIMEGKAKTHQQEPIKAGDQGRAGIPSESGSEK